MLILSNWLTGGVHYAYLSNWLTGGVHLCLFYLIG